MRNCIGVHTHTYTHVHTHMHTHTHTPAQEHGVSVISADRGGTRCFTSKGCEFGWVAIESMYQREISRIREGKCSRVPKLKESHIIRDSWTRLNVLPSKIMQVWVHTIIDNFCTFVYMYMYIRIKINFLLAHIMVMWPVLYNITHVKPYFF